MRTQNHWRQNRLGCLTVLESRVTPTTVTDPGDNGDDLNPIKGSLREAIIIANKTSAPDSISFKLPGSTLSVLLYGNAVFNDPVSIDGTTQPGYAGTPLINMSGFNVYGRQGITIRGVVVGGVGQLSVDPGTDSPNAIENCYIGTDNTGTALASGGGVYLDHMENATIRNNVIAGSVLVGDTNNDQDQSGTSTYLIESNHIGTDITGTATWGGGLTIDFGGNCTLRNNVITDGVSIAQVLVGPGNNILTGNKIGTDGTGSTAIGTGEVKLSGPNNIIGGTAPGEGNVIGNGLTFFSGNGSTIVGNRIGVDAAGMKALAFAGEGINITGSSSVTIGGTGIDARNIIAGNVVVSGVGAISNIIVQGNYLGVDATGNSSLSIGGGIHLDHADKSLVADNIICGGTGAGVRITDMFMPTPSGNTVQGNKIGVMANGKASGNAAEGVYLFQSKNTTITDNVIAANGKDGIYMGLNFTFGGNKVLNNIIGTNDTDDIGLGNGFSGISIQNSANNIVIGNVISANTSAGVQLGSSTFGNIIQGNLIGVKSDGATPLGNLGYGVYIWGVSHDNKVGGPGNDDGNVIANNGSLYGRQGHGIEIQSGAKNELRRNSIHDNSGRGIDLNYDGFTINDPNGDYDTGANELQNYPVIISRPQGPDTVGQYTWRLNSTPNKTFTIEFFADDNLDSSGFGEGREFLGDQVIIDGMTKATITTDSIGLASFMNPAFTNKKHICATATNTETKNTSEFSMVDTDADGLADAWETTGIDIDEDGTPDLVLTDAKPNHKDLFVEVDSQTGFAPDPVIFDATVAPADNKSVVVAFAQAPDMFVHNPDQTTGIKLHVLNDEKNLPVKTFKADFLDFDEQKNGKNGTGLDNAHFGTLDDRFIGGNEMNGPNPKWQKIRAAKKLVYRYCIFAEAYSDPRSSGLSVLSNHGWGTNNFMVTTPAGSWGALTAQDSAGTFMHELGHTLNLRHGGADDTLAKPNYHSVMNYTWQVPDYYIRNGQMPLLGSYAISWVLDYSREKLDLNEVTGLDESKGIGTTDPLYAKFNVPYGHTLNSGKLGLEPGPINWNNNADNKEAGVMVDINFDNKITALPGQEDWSQLKFYFLESEFANVYPGGNTEVGNLTKSPAPTVASVTVNDGSPQRSRVTSVTVVFSSVVNFPATSADGLELRRQSDNAPVDLTATIAHSVADTTVTLTFPGNLSQFGSLADGRYALNVLASKIGNSWGALDGDANGVGGDDYVFASATAPAMATNIFRLFGDSNGDGTVNGTDFLAFRLAFLSTNAIFDFDGDGQVTGTDFLQFRLRFLQMI